MACFHSTELLRVTDIAGLLGVRPAELRRRVRNGTVPAVRVGKLIRVRRHDAAVLLNREKRVPLKVAIRLIRNTVAKP